MFDNVQHLGNYVAGLANRYRVADSYILFGDEILIMERCTAYKRTCNHNGFKHSRRGQNACPADVYLNVNNLCLLLLGRIFKGNRPFREF